ncbi:MAG TPA: hypothetical protein VIC35_09310 [Acidimicrobiia bacterium]
MAKNPDPSLELTTSKGVTRTLDDWSTMFQLCLVILPDRPEAAAWIPVAQRIGAVLGDSDVRTAYVVTSTAAIARRILGEEADRVLTFVDPDQALVRSLGLEHLPAFVYLRQDTTVGAAADGWNVSEWQNVAKETAAAMQWSVPDLAPPGKPLPAASAGWPV